MKGVDLKRIYLIEHMASRVPVWLKPLMKYSFFLRLWRKWCIRKVNRMTYGEVLGMYYEVTGNDR